MWGVYLMSGPVTWDVLWLFVTVRMQWTQPLQMNLGVPTPRAAHGMCAIGTNIFIFGGRDIEDRQNDLHSFDTGEKQVHLQHAIHSQCVFDLSERHECRAANHYVLVIVYYTRWHYTTLLRSWSYHYAPHPPPTPNPHGVCDCATVCVCHGVCVWDCAMVCAYVRYCFNCCVWYFNCFNYITLSSKTHLLVVLCLLYCSLNFMYYYFTSQPWPKQNCPLWND